MCVCLIVMNMISSPKTNLEARVVVTYVFCYIRYKGGPPLPRKLISQGVTQKNFFVEVYLLCLKLIDSRDGSECIIRLSKKVFFIFYISFDSLKTWMVHGGRKILSLLVFI